MKKYFCFILALLCLLVSCKKGSSTDEIINNLINDISSCNSYKSVCQMSIVNGEIKKEFNIELNYLSGDYYKASFTNGDNNTKQIILKNNNGVFALTPALKKEFKFESDWPNNGSHIYIPSNVILDYKADSNSVITNENDMIVLQSSINHKIHTNYKYQKIYIKNNTISSVEYYDESNNIKVSASYSSITYNVKLTNNDFNEEEIMNIEIISLGEGEVFLEGDISVSYIIDGSSMTNSNENIFVFEGEYNYTVCINDVEVNEYYNVSRIYNDVFLGEEGLIFISDVSVSMFFYDKEIIVYSKDLDTNEIINILNSVTIV